MGIMNKFDRALRSYGTAKAKANGTLMFTICNRDVYKDAIDVIEKKYNVVVREINRHHTYHFKSYCTMLVFMVSPWLYKNTLYKLKIR